MDEYGIEGLLRLDFSEGTGTFRDALLARCLAIIESSEKPDAESDLGGSLLRARGEDRDQARADVHATEDSLT